VNTFYKTVANRYRYSLILLRQLVITDFKLRYQGSVLGYVWSLLRPLAIFVILYFVFVRFLKVGHSIPHFPVYLLLGIVLWNFFVEVTTGNVSAVVMRGDLIRKLNFPRYVIIVAGSLAALINLLINFVVVVFFMYLSHTGISWQAVWIIPLVVELYLLALGVAFFLSATNVFLRDIGYIWDVIIQGAFYATPILYPLSSVPHAAAKALVLNPMAQIIQDARYTVITHQTQTISSFYPAWWVRAGVIVLVIVVTGAAAYYFRKLSRNFAENV